MIFSRVLSRQSEQAKAEAAAAAPEAGAPPPLPPEPPPFVPEPTPVTPQPPPAAQPPAAERAEAPVAAPGRTAAALPAQRIALSAAELPLWNALASYQNVPLTLGPVQLTYALAERLGPGTAHATVAAKGSSVPPVRLAVRRFPVSELFGTALDADRLDELPAHLGDAIRAAMVDALAERLPQPFVERVTVDPAAHRIQAGDAHDVAVAVTLAGLMGEPVEIALEGRPRALLALLPVTEVAGLAVQQELGQAIPVALSIRLGTLDIPAATLAGLAAGDVMLCHPSTRIDRLALVAAGRAAALVPREGGLALETPLMIEHDAASPAPAGEAAEALALEELPVRLEFVIAEETVPAATLLALQPGAVLPVAAPSLEEEVAVTVRANGAVIATGDLVRLDDRLGVRIQTLRNPGR